MAETLIRMFCPQCGYLLWYVKACECCGWSYATQGGQS